MESPSSDNFETNLCQRRHDSAKSHLIELCFEKNLNPRPPESLSNLSYLVIEMITSSKRKPSEGM